MSTAKKQKFRAGAGVGTVHFPAELFPIEGFEKVHDEPHIRVLVMGLERLCAIVSAELVLLPQEWIDGCKRLLEEELGVEPDCVWVHVTHAISTPHAPGTAIPPNGGWQEGELEAKRALYDAAIRAALAEAAREAGEALCSARVGVGVCDSDLLESRDIQTPDGVWIGRNGFGPTNKLVTVLRFESARKKPIAFLVNYAMKPCVLDNSQMTEGKRQVSSDAPGYACTMLEKILGVPVLYCMSAAGDQTPIELALFDQVGPDGKLCTVDLGVEAGLVMVSRLGGKLASDVLTIADSILCGAVEKPVLMQERKILWKTKRPQEKRPGRVPNYEEGPEEAISVSVINLEQTMLVACKPEINCITDLQLKAKCVAKHTLLISMVNGGQKYLPEREAYERNSWEAMSSQFMPGAAERLVEVAVDMTRELSEGAALKEELPV